MFATVSTDEKLDFLHKTYGVPHDHIFSSRNVSFQKDVVQITAGKGVDVVLNSLSGALLQASWECPAPLGRFIELGKTDAQLNNCLQMVPFNKAVSYMAMDIGQLGLRSGKLISSTFRKVMELLGSKEVVHRIPILLYGLRRT